VGGVSAREYTLAVPIMKTLGLGPLPLVFVLDLGFGVKEDLSDVVEEGMALSFVVPPPWFLLGLLSGLLFIAFLSF